MVSVAHADSPEGLNQKQAQEIAVEAYTYLYPLVTMDVTRKQATNIDAGKMPGRGPMNHFAHIRSYPGADWKEVVRPNYDTLYSLAWLDLTNGPLLLSVPDTQGRYYLMSMLDMWTDVFAAPGKRTSGTEPQVFVIVPPGWKGKLPANIQRIDAPTLYVWVIGRTQTNGPTDFEAVRKIQDGYYVGGMGESSDLPPGQVLATDPTVDMKTPPLEQVNAMPAKKFFAYAAELLKVHKPHINDWSIVTRMERIGIEPGKSFDLEKCSDDVKSALEKAPADALAAMKAKLPSVAAVKNGWQMNVDTMGVYGNDYLKRGIIALIGLGANPPEEAIYPLNIADAEGKPVDGANKYVIHFEKEELPPVEAFWSITMYHKDGFPIANPLNRFAVGDRDNLKFNPDGSLDIYIQRASPGAEKEANWLPSGEGPLGITMRLYAPKPVVLEGGWAPPPIRLVY
jgi:hypothetical protein